MSIFWRAKNAGGTFASKRGSYYSPMRSAKKTIQPKAAFRYRKHLTFLAPPSIHVSFLIWLIPPIHPLPLRGKETLSNVPPTDPLHLRCKELEISKLIRRVFASMVQSLKLAIDVAMLRTHLTCLIKLEILMRPCPVRGKGSVEQLRI